MKTLVNKVAEIVEVMAEIKAKMVVGMVEDGSAPLTPGAVLAGAECCTTLVPPYNTCNFPWLSKLKLSCASNSSMGSCGGVV